MKKKILATMLAAMMVLSLAACGKKDTAKADANEKVSEAETEMSTESPATLEDESTEAASTEATETTEAADELTADTIDKYYGFEYSKSVPADEIQAEFSDADENTPTLTITAMPSTFDQLLVNASDETKGRILGDTSAMSNGDEVNIVAKYPDLFTNDADGILIYKGPLQNVSQRAYSAGADGTTPRNETGSYSNSYYACGPALLMANEKRDTYSLGFTIKIINPTADFIRGEDAQWTDISTDAMDTHKAYKIGKTGQVTNGTDIKTLLADSTFPKPTSGTIREHMVVLTWACDDGTTNMDLSFDPSSGEMFTIRYYTGS